MQPTKNKKLQKSIAMAAGAVVLLTAIVVLTITVLHQAEKSKTDETSESPRSVTKSDADTLYKSGRDLFKKGDTKAAKEALVKARDTYTQLHDKARVAEVNTLIKQIDNTPKQMEPTKVSPPATQPN